MIATIPPIEIVIGVIIVVGIGARWALGDRAPDWLPRLGRPSLGPGAWDTRMKDASIPPRQDDEGDGVRDSPDAPDRSP